MSNGVRAKLARVPNPYNWMTAAGAVGLGAERVLNFVPRSLQHADLKERINNMVPVKKQAYNKQAYADEYTRNLPTDIAYKTRIKRT
jgi:hypothetical protein